MTLARFSPPAPPQAVLLHRLNLPYPIPQHTDTSQQNSHPPQPSTPKKARGVCRGAAALRPLCGFPIFAKKYCVRSPIRTFVRFVKSHYFLWFPYPYCLVLWIFQAIFLFSAFFSIKIVSQPDFHELSTFRLQIPILTVIIKTWVLS